MPIYYILGEIKNVSPHMYGVWTLLEVHETTVDDVVSGKFDANARHYALYQAGHYNVQSIMVAREISNPFQEMGEKAV